MFLLPFSCTCTYGSNVAKHNKASCPDSGQVAIFRDTKNVQNIIVALCSEIVMLEVGAMMMYTKQIMGANTCSLLCAIYICDPCI